MRSRSVLAIVFIGIGGLAAMAAVTKLAFDNDEGLRDVVKFKRSVVEVFGPRGIEEVVYRPPGRRGAALLRIVADPARIDEASPTIYELADFVVESFPRHRGTLDLELLAQKSGGCQEVEPFLEKQFVVSKLKSARAARDCERKVLDAVQGSFPAARLKSLVRVKSTIELDFEVPDDEKHRSAEALGSIAGLVQGAAKRNFGIPRKGRLRLRVLAAGEHVCLDAEYDDKGRQLRLDIVKPPPRPAVDGLEIDGLEIDGLEIDQTASNSR